MKPKFTASEGNVVLESVFGILIFGTLIFPIASTIAQVVKVNSELRQTAFVIARAFSVEDQENDYATASQTASWYESRKGYEIQITCNPSCAAVNAEVTVVVSSNLNLVGIETLQQRVKLERNLYAE